MAQAPQRQPDAKKNDYADTAKAKALMERCLQDAKGNTVRLERDKQDLENLLFYRGGPENQWTAWSEDSHTWRTIPEDGDDAIPAWVPRCVTNVYAKKIDGVISILNQSQPAQLWKPATDDDEDIAAADVCEDGVPALLEEIDYPRNLKGQINNLVALTDKVAVLYYYDTHEKYGMSKIGLLECPQCGVITTPMQVQDAGEACPDCGQSEEMAPVVDPQTFEPQGVDYPKGKLCAKVVSSLEFSIPHSARSCDERAMPWVMFHNREDKHECLRMWEGIASTIDEASKDAKWSSQQRAFADQMHRLSSPRAAQQRGIGGDAKDTGPVVYRLLHDPIADGEFNFPDGLYAVMIGGEIAEAGPLTVFDDDDQPIKNCIIRTFAQGPGSAFGKPPADDMVPLQRQRNIIETLALMILLHHAAPRTFIPLSVQLEDEISGIPGQDVRYRTTVPGEKPTTEPGRNPPEGLYKTLEMIDAKFDELSGLNSVLQGERPSGDPTLGEVQRLEERGMAMFRTPLDNLIEFELKQSRMVLWIARQSAWSGRFLKVKGENGGWEVEQFHAASLKGRVDVFCEPASAWPRSPLTQQLRIRQLVELGVINPMMDPEISAKLFEIYDLPELKPSLDVDRKQIARELDRWKAAVDPAEIMPPKQYINVGMHLHLKTNFLKTEEAEKLELANPPVFGAMVMHIQMLQQQQMMAQMAQAAAQAGGPPSGQGDEKGKGGDPLQDAIDKGALRPKGAGGDPLERATQSGALVPAGAMPKQGVSIDALIKQGILRPAASEAVN